MASIKSSLFPSRRHGLVYMLVPSPGVGCASGHPGGSAGCWPPLAALLSHPRTRILSSGGLERRGGWWRRRKIAVVAARAGNTVFFSLELQTRVVLARDSAWLRWVSATQGGVSAELTACGSGTQARGTAEIGP